ncbi:hypothetical protein AXG93_2550s1200 [Marchantia polymorpha subsp. ruderalis]|uniref:Uncharacterized protein n=1 Tax=Marchantia polymorpha subsp. ruderalis TaxID=1480154 RepID=A0A176VN81_MARPO|nr:hypothetical protein AXG93_2550s1200 [Marchantia polymorpha subsp. ruderalis]
MILESQGRFQEATGCRRQGMAVPAQPDGSLHFQGPRHVDRSQAHRLTLPATVDHGLRQRKSVDASSFVGSRSRRRWTDRQLVVLTDAFLPKVIAPLPKDFRTIVRRPAHCFFPDIVKEKFPMVPLVLP